MMFCGAYGSRSAILQLLVNMDAAAKMGLRDEYSAQCGVVAITGTRHRCDCSGDVYV